MKVIIAGSRDINDYAVLKRAIKDSKFTITEVVSGCCRGIDRLGERWAKDNNIPVKKFPAKWQEYGVAAGPIRNEQMAEYAHAAIVIFKEGSKGSQCMMDIARDYDLFLFKVGPVVVDEKGMVKKGI